MKYLWVLMGTISLFSCNFSEVEKPKIEDLTTISKKNDNTQEIEQMNKPYHPEEDAKAKIASLVEEAKNENKNIIIQAGGNWCIWCLRFDKFRKENAEIKNIIDENFLYYHLNFSKENENKELFEQYGNPGDLGYPVFVILDKEGKQIHTQESGSLEDGKNGYNVEKVKGFLNSWLPK